ncbi:MAG: methyltransferase domain-containing protein [Deltaproteobacteria bacterium]|nr:methyltransferase domain-containing protein [Deltaproteobacteria bacterium]
MPGTQLVEENYTHGRLLEAIREGIGKLGKTVDSVQIDDLAPVDEFHIGGRQATESFLDQLQIAADHQVLDVGCGLGGGSRFAAQRYGCRVTGIDLTQEYVETGNELCRWVGLSDRIHLEVHNATSLPHPGETFDRAFMMHVGMNIADKEALASELYRVMRPGGKVGIYDIMEAGKGDLAFPVPWAMDREGSSVASPAAYKAALQAAGFKIIAERNRRDFALEFFSQLRAKMKSAEGPPPLGLHILMGQLAPVKIKMMIENISHNRIAPVEIIAEKASD